MSVLRRLGAGRKRTSRREKKGLSPCRTAIARLSSGPGHTSPTIVVFRLPKVHVSRHCSSITENEGIIDKRSTSKSIFI